MLCFICFNISIVIGWRLSLAEAPFARLIPRNSRRRSGMPFCELNPSSIFCNRTAERYVLIVATLRLLARNAEKRRKFISESG